MCPDLAPDLDPPFFFNTFQDADKKCFSFFGFSVLGIRMSLSLQDPDPDPFVRGADPDPHQMSRITLLSVFIDNRSLRRSNKTVEIKVYPIFFFCF